MGFKKGKGGQIPRFHKEDDGEMLCVKKGLKSRNDEIVERWARRERGGNSVLKE